MLHELGIQVVFLGKRELEHDQLIGFESVELLAQCRLEQRFGPGLGRTMNVHFGLDDRHQVRGDDLPSDLELLAHDARDPRLVRLLDERAHLGSEDALGDGAAEQRPELRHRLHQLDAVLLLRQPLVHLQERPHALHVPAIVRGRLALDAAIHGVLEQDGAEDSLAGEGRARDDARAHLMHEREHLFLVGPRAVLDAVGPERAGRAPSALIQRRDEAGLALHLLQLLEVAHGPYLAFLRIRYRRMRLFVELSCWSVGSASLSSSGMMRWASTLPSSTPHWSNESTSQMTPWVNTLCS